MSQYSFLDESTITTVEELMESISFKKEQQDSWDDMIAEINSNYQKIMKWVKLWNSWLQRPCLKIELYFSAIWMKKDLLKQMTMACTPYPKGVQTWLMQL